MSTKPFDHHTVLDLFDHKILGQYASIPSGEPKAVRDIPEPEFGRPDESLDADNRQVIKYTSELRAMNSDGRLDYVMAANPAITEDNIGELVLTTHRDWLDDSARNRMRAIARVLAQEHRHPSEVLSRWLTEQEFERFHEALDETRFPDPILATCYALCEANELAHASYRTQQDRLLLGVAMPRIIQTPEEIAADLRAARLR